MRVEVNTALAEEARIRGNHKTKTAAAVAALKEYIRYKKAQRRELRGNRNSRDERRG